MTIPSWDLKHGKDAYVDARLCQRLTEAYKCPDSDRQGFEVTLLFLRSLKVVIWSFSPVFYFPAVERESARSQVGNCASAMSVALRS